MAERLEIMAPVGGREQLTAALRCRADAVYFGLPDFNARRNAENFAAEGLDGIVQECHRRGVNVYITINTVVMDSELAAAKRAVDTAASAGADAIIVQDLAVAAYARQAWPDLKLFASTQMAIHNAAGARLAKQAGFSRVVLARELSLPEIRQIIEETGIETEVFVHGAHCMSVSGNCYLSSVIGGRSGNRGLCAQPCRLDWTCGGADHCLSLKDLSYVEHIRELQEAGVCSLKIEGRMKRAEYVAAAVTACRKALAGEEPDLEALRSVFSRSGFTDGYLTGRRDASMYGYRTKEDVLAAAGVLKDLAKLYEKEEPLHSVDLFFLAKEGQPAELRAVCEGQSAAVTGPVPEAALHLELTEETVRRSLEKTGGTLYRIGRLRCAIDPGLMLPASALNAMRCEVLEMLDGRL